MAESRDTHQFDSFIIHDPDTGEECWVGVRAVGNAVLLALSRQSDGDVEVSLTRDEAKRLAKALS